MEYSFSFNVSSFAYNSSSANISKQCNYQFGSSPSFPSQQVSPHINLKLDISSLQCLACSPMHVAVAHNPHCLSGRHLALLFWAILGYVNVIETEIGIGVVALVSLPVSLSLYFVYLKRSIQR